MKVVRDPALKDFRNFVWLLWKHLGLPQPTEVQLSICSYLQHGPKRSMVSAYRGCGKSWITAAYALYYLYWGGPAADYSANILVVSASSSRASDFSTFCHRLISEVPWLRHLAPTEGQRDSKISWDVGPAPAMQSPSCKSLGASSTLTGSRADLIIADDVESLANSASVLQREKISTSIKEFEAIIKPHDEARIIFLGTPQTVDSIYRELPNRGYKIQVWPALYPKVDEVSAYGDTLAPIITDKLYEGGSYQEALSWTPTDTRFSELDLAEREASYGASDFKLQYQLDTSSHDGLRMPLRCADMPVLSCDPQKAPESIIRSNDPNNVVKDLDCMGLRGDRWYSPLKINGDWIPYQQIVCAIDPAGKGLDELAWCVAGTLNGYIYVLECAGLSGGFQDSNLHHLAERIKHFNCTVAIIEENFGQGMFTNLLAPILREYGCKTKLENVRHSTQKERRIISSLEPLLNQGRVIISRSVVEEDLRSRPDLPEEQRLRRQLIYALSRITVEKGCLTFDDRLDAMAMAVTHFKKEASLDADLQQQRRQRKLMLEEINKVRKHWGVNAPSTTNWTSNL